LGAQGGPLPPVDTGGYSHSDTFVSLFLRLYQKWSNHPSLNKEGKVLIHIIITFSSSLRRSTPDGIVRGEVVDF